MHTTQVILSNTVTINKASDSACARTATVRGREKAVSVR